MDQDLLNEILSADGVAMATWMSWHYLCRDEDGALIMEQFDQPEWYTLRAIVEHVAEPDVQAAAALLLMEDVEPMHKGSLMARLSGMPEWDLWP